MIGVGMVVLYVLYKKFYKPMAETEIWYTDEEPKSGAIGQQCVCQGSYMGTCINWFGIGDCCERKCRNKIHSKL